MPAMHESGRLRTAVIDLAVAGVRPTKIAERLRCSISSVYYYRLAEGLVTPMRPHADDYRRAGRVICRFTPAEDRALGLLSQRGLSYLQIARIMIRLFPDRPRKPHTVNARLHLLALRQELAA